MHIMGYKAWRKVCGCPRLVTMICCLAATLVLFSNIANASKDKCKMCKEIVEDFKKGLIKTAKSNFGGGNTHWEERALGSWTHSETRLMEIWEDLCSSGGKECHFLLEKHEEDLEDYWFHVFPQQDTATDLHDWLCIDKLQVCCPGNTYGPECRPCLGVRDMTCKGNGKCDGEGTREGTGRCECNDGYHGDICDECTDRYYEEVNNETHTICTACHESCESTCSEGGPKGCDDCKSGWRETEDEGCVDVDECVEDSPCEENQYCANTPGKYNCATCHRACAGCTAYGANKCDACQQGYTLQNYVCTDVNECEEDKMLCSGDKLRCENNDGSYTCICDGGFIYDGEICIPKPKDLPKSKQPKDKSKQDKQKRKESATDRPSLLFLFAMIVVFYACCTIVNWNMSVVFVLSVVLGTFIYWFGSQHDKL